MTVHLSDNLVASLQKLADVQGRDLSLIVDEAVREYLVASSITDLTPEQVAETQLRLTPELERLDPYNIDEGQ
jgi:predicted transcriptional regulator